MRIGREIKVGVFVFLGLVVVGLVVMLIGDERHIFARHITLETSFSDVQGLKVGAPVRMDGIDVGTISKVGHSEDVSDPRIHVRMDVVRSEALRLKVDAFAKISNKGLLGDKLLDLDTGKGAPRPVTDVMIRGEDPTDFAGMFSDVSSIARRTDSVLGHLDKMSSNLADDALQAEVKSTVHSVTIIMKQLAEGDGYARKLLSDPAESERLSRTVANFERTSTELAQATAEIRQLTSRINQGPGFAHDLVYSDKGSQTLSQFGNAAGEVALTLKGVREGNGLAKGVLYGDSEQQQIIGNLNTMSRDMRDIVAGMKAGKGTMGALLVDPSVYEDMKMILGNVQRNDVLRALVRYSIKQDEKKPAVDVKDAKPAP
ncbi:MAG: MCE family protein [Deltaproteobacteria bacterium]|nr:MCE family protein [Deltaproteobacteria bacterium]